MSKVIFETTTGMHISVERYNHLVEAERFLNLTERGLIPLEMVAFEHCVILAVPKDTRLIALIKAAAELMPVSTFADGPTMRTADGRLMELQRTVGDSNIEAGQRLFITG